ncbi:MAG: tRNA (adenosine(37)-N6)-threonylcarbamoyltransferase complex dimerization subunit type 1 TsaB [Desulfovibrionaceae bacterium]
MSLRLICNAAEGVLQLLLVRDNTLLCAQAWPAPTRSTEIMAPALAHMWQELGCSVRDITQIACVHGPGSFTGIRLVLSTAAALRRALHVPVAALDYMHALALSGCCRLHATPLPIAAGTLWVLTHARRDLLHCQPFRLPALGGNSQAEPAPLVPLAPVDLFSLAACAHRINAQSLDSAALCLGSGLVRNASFFREQCPKALLCGSVYAEVSTQALCLLAQHASYVHADPRPLYIRPCDAVENLPAMAARQGRDAAEAQLQLDDLLKRPTTPDFAYRS